MLTGEKVFEPRAVKLGGGGPAAMSTNFKALRVSGRLLSWRKSRNSSIDWMYSAPCRRRLFVLLFAYDASSKPQKKWAGSSKKWRCCREDSLPTENLKSTFFSCWIESVGSMTGGIRLGSLREPTLSTQENAGLSDDEILHRNRTRKVAGPLELARLPECS